MADDSNENKNKLNKHYIFMCIICFLALNFFNIVFNKPVQNESVQSEPVSYKHSNNTIKNIPNLDDSYVNMLSQLREIQQSIQK